MPTAYIVCVWVHTAVVTYRGKTAVTFRGRTAVTYMGHRRSHSCMCRSETRSDSSFPDLCPLWKWLRKDLTILTGFPGFYVQRTVFHSISSFRSTYSPPVRLGPIIGLYSESFLKIIMSVTAWGHLRCSGYLCAHQLCNGEPKLDLFISTDANNKQYNSNVLIISVKILSQLSPSYCF